MFTITKINRYNRNGKTRYYIEYGNGMSAHVSESQLVQRGVNPNQALNLVGSQIKVDYFQEGEELINGDICTESGIIVKDFSIDKSAKLLMAESFAQAMMAQFGMSPVSSTTGSTSQLNSATEEVMEEEDVVESATA